MNHLAHFLALAAFAASCTPTTTPPEEVESVLPELLEVPYSRTVVVAGAENVPMLPLQVAETDGVELEEMSVQLVVNSTGMFLYGIQGDLNPADYIDVCWVESDYDGTALAGPETPDTEGRVVFKNIVLGPDDSHVRCNVRHISFFKSVAIAATVVGSGVNENADHLVVVMPHGHFIAWPPDVPLSGDVQAGTKRLLAGVWNARALYESIVVHELPAVFLGDAEVIGGMYLSYWDEEGDLVTRTSFLAEETTLFAGLDAFVPQDGAVEVRLEVDVNEHVGGQFRFGIDFSRRLDEIVGVTSGKVIRGPIPFSIVWGGEFAVVPRTP